MFFCCRFLYFVDVLHVQVQPVRGDKKRHPTREARPAHVDDYQAPQPVYPPMGSKNTNAVTSL